MIPLQQTGRTNDRPSNDRPRVRSKRQDRLVRLIYHRNRIITAENTTRRTPGVANVQIRVRLFAEEYVDLDSELCV